ncbi:hypothetical protein QFZ75_004731 [Streptomyces sp. V3I8]|uniref:hypothetical protein n=1 Tax=Streptomyces sp. V3I8 TaxID=3042279 RepID=UPI00278736FE|nr:hypothetical protein [Streptomyces sp. V3I8]MDQ1038315.1 hypothetical protein [Streptomyces sp. V3I8]
MGTPDGHEELVKVYGTGCFDEFLWIFAEGAENENLDISSRTAAARVTFREKKLPALREALADLRSAPEELIQWGVTDNGDSLLWVPVGNPEDWPTIVLQAGQLDFSVCLKSSTGLILDLLSRALRLRIFPEDFPSPHPEFSPDPYA